VAGRQGGLGEIGAHATAGSSDKPNLLVTTAFPSMFVFMIRGFRPSDSPTRSLAGAPRPAPFAPAAGPLHPRSARPP
jgi:hypothetical protein